MEQPAVAPEIIDFYTTAYDEASRLSVKAHGLLEKIRTQELLRRHLPTPPAGVLDVGGGPGAHARWLAADGYRVPPATTTPRSDSPPPTSTPWTGCVSR